MIVALLFGLLAVSAIALMFVGVKSLRTDPLDVLSPEDRALIKAESRLRKRRSGFVTKAGERIGPSLGRLFGGKYRDWVESQITYEGRNQYSSYATFLEFKGSVLLLCTLGGVALLIFLKMPFFFLLLFVMGLVLPDLQLYSAAKKRQEQIDDQLPDFLDILAITVTAGLSFRSALSKVTERTDGPLAQEMRTVLHQLDMGETVYEAFDALRKRTTSEPLESFVTSLLQAEELGAPLAETLETISLDMRQTTAQKARQTAAKASPKIAAVVTMIMVPGTMVLILVSMFFVADLDQIDLGNAGN